MVIRGVYGVIGSNLPIWAYAYTCVSIKQGYNNYKNYCRKSTLNDSSRISFMIVLARKESSCVFIFFPISVNLMFTPGIPFKTFFSALSAC